VPLSDVDLRFTLTVPKNTHQFGHPKNNIRVQQHLLTQEKKKKLSINDPNKKKCQKYSRFKASKRG